MKHRTLALLLAAAMLAALPACGGNADGEVPSDSPAVTEPAEPDAAPDSSAPAESDAPAADAPEDTSEPSDAPGEPSEEPSDEVCGLPLAPSSSPSVSPSPSTPAENPSQAPSQAPSQSPQPAPEPEPSVEPSPEPSQSASVDLQAFYEDLCADENFGANMALEGEFLTAYYPGLSDIATKQQIVCMPMISSVVCEIALVEVENAADVDAVKAIFQARIDSQVGTDENPGLACYPESIRGWQEDSRIVSNGNYVMLIAWWDYCDNAVTAFNALF